MVSNRPSSQSDTPRKTASTYSVVDFEDPNSLTLTSNKVDHVRASRDLSMSETPVGDLRGDASGLPTEADMSKSRGGVGGLSRDHPIHSVNPVVAVGDRRETAQAIQHPHVHPTSKNIIVLPPQSVDAMEVGKVAIDVRDLRLCDEGRQRGLVKEVVVLDLSGDLQMSGDPIFSGPHSNDVMDVDKVAVQSLKLPVSGKDVLLLGHGDVVDGVKLVEASGDLQMTRESSLSPRHSVNVMEVDKVLVPS